MNTYVEINGNYYPAIITGKNNDSTWNNRASKEIRLEMNYNDAISIFTNDIKWNIVQEREETIEEETIIVKDIYDNSEYSIAGDIIDHRDGTISIKMVKPTAEELLAMLEEVL